MSRALNDADEAQLLKVLKSLQQARKRWCAEIVDDAEEMWADIPELLDEIVPDLERILGVQPLTEDA